MRFSFVLFLCLLLSTSTISFAQTTSVHGSMPKNGASGLLCNAVIAVGLQYASPDIGIDPLTLNASSVRMFSKTLPHQMVEVFLIADDYLQSLVVEPRDLLAPQTEYVFEITSELKDIAGNSFGPYRINFTTGEKSIAKRTTTERKKIVHKQKIAYGPPHSSLASILVPPKPKASALVQEKNAADSPVNQPVPATPTQNQAEATNTMDTQDALVDKTTEQTAAKPEKQESTLKARFLFPKDEIAQKGRLPLLIELPKKAEVKYIIKNTSGKVVREGSAQFIAGKYKKALSSG